MTTAAVSTAPSVSVAENVSNRAIASAVLRRLGVSILVVVLALVLLTLLWIVLLKAFSVSSFVGKTPGDVLGYLFDDGAVGRVRPKSITAVAARTDLVHAWVVTLGNAAIGFLGGMVAAVAIAASFTIVKPLEFAFMPIAMLLRSVPLVAMAPVLILMFGQGKVGIVVIVAIVVLFPVLVNVVLGLNSASPLALDLIRVNGGSDLKTLVMVRLPSALPALFASIRISVPGAIVGAMLAEWLTGFTGLGGVLNAYKGSGNFSGVWAIVVVSVTTSLVAYAVASVLETAALAAWGPNAGKSS